MISIILVLIVFIIDRYSKVYISKNLEKLNKYKVNKHIQFVYTENYGMAFNLFKKYNIINLLILISFIIIIYLAYYLIKYYSYLSLIEKIFYSLILGGGIGNLFDRIYSKYVIDFISIKLYKYYLPIMNFADIFIFGGCIFLIIYNFFI